MVGKTVQVTIFPWEERTKDGEKVVAEGKADRFSSRVFPFYVFFLMDLNFGFAQVKDSVNRQVLPKTGSSP